MKTNLRLNRNYNKILASDWLSPAMIFAQIGQCNWTVRVMLRGRPILFITHIITDQIGLQSAQLPLFIIAFGARRAPL